MDKEKRENKIKDLMETAMKDINTIIDVNTVIGKPFSINDGTTVIPVTKVTLGFMTGGGEYGELKSIKGEAQTPFAGGSGAIRGRDERLRGRCGGQRRPVRGLRLYGRYPGRKNRRAGHGAGRLSALDDAGKRGVRPPT